MSNNENIQWSLQHIAFFIMAVVFACHCRGMEVGNEEYREGDILVCRQETELSAHSSGRADLRSVLPSRTIVRVAQCQRDERFVGQLLVVPVGPEKVCQPGFIFPRTTSNISGFLRSYPTDPPHIYRYDIGETPEQIRQSSPAVLAKWNDLRVRITRAQAAGTPEPSHFVERARLWSAVHNRQKAFEDYLEAARVAISGATSDEELVARSLYVLGLYENVARVQPEPPYLSISDPPFAQGGGEQFASAHTLFWNGRYEEAVRVLDVAVSANPYEPVYWYYRALAKHRLGKKTEAEHDVRMGAFWEHQVRAAGQGPFVVIGSGYIADRLQRVQGPLRFWLESHRFVAVNKDHTLKPSSNIRNLITTQ